MSRPVKLDVEGAADEHEAVEQAAGRAALRGRQPDGQNDGGAGQETGLEDAHEEAAADQGVRRAAAARRTSARAADQPTAQQTMVRRGPDLLGEPAGRRLQHGVEEEEEAGRVAGLGGREVQLLADGGFRAAVAVALDVGDGGGDAQGGHDDVADARRPGGEGKVGGETHGQAPGGNRAGDVA